MDQEQISKSRKDQHIELVSKSKFNDNKLDRRFNYEPIFNPHPTTNVIKCKFLKKELNAPLWISSMTGGAGISYKVNKNLAKACREFKLGMGLGSCRPLLINDKYIDDFNLRPIIGDDLPFYANLGISQIEKLIEEDNYILISRLVDKLKVDGLIVHINPLQEWFQLEGDILKRPALETIERLLELVKFPIIVKEVGQGMGPMSLRSLMKLPLAAIEFSAFGGTNFSNLEIMRNPKMNIFKEFSYIGHNAEEMVDMVNNILKEEKLTCNNFIISGGIESFIQGYYLINKCNSPAIYGKASEFLKYAVEGYDQLAEYIGQQLQGLAMANSFLDIRQ